MKKLFIPQDSSIMAIYPKYTEEGDTTRILCIGEEGLQVRSSVEKVLSCLAMRSNRSLKLVRTWLYRDEDGGSLPSRHLGRTLGIDHRLTLIPFKARRPIVSSDGAYGYVNYKYLMDVRPSHRNDEYVTELVLKDGRILLSMWGIQTINRRVEEAERIQHRFHLIGEEIMEEIRTLFHDSPYRPWDRNRGRNKNY